MARGLAALVAVALAITSLLVLTTLVMLALLVPTLVLVVLLVTALLVPTLTVTTSPSAPVSSLLTALTVLAALAVLTPSGFSAGPVALIAGLQVLLAVDPTTAVPAAHVFVLAELARVGPSTVALLVLAVPVAALLAAPAVLTAVAASLLPTATTLLALPVDVAPPVLVLDGLADSGLSAVAGLLVVPTALIVLAAGTVLTAVTVPVSLAVLLMLAGLLLVSRLLVLAGLLDGFLVLGVTVADLLVGVRVVMLTRPLGLGSPRSVPAARGVSALLGAVAHLLVLVLPVTSTASPSALVVLCHVRVPIEFSSGFPYTYWAEFDTQKADERVFERIRHRERLESLHPVVGQPAVADLESGRVV